MKIYRGILQRWIKHKVDTSDLTESERYEKYKIPYYYTRNKYHYYTGTLDGKKMSTTCILDSFRGYEETMFSIYKLGRRSKDEDK